MHTLLRFAVLIKRIVPNLPLVKILARDFSFRFLFKKSIHVIYSL